MIDRRTFIQCAEMAGVTTPALLALLPLISKEDAKTSTYIGSARTLVRNADENIPIFKIDGWEYLCPKDQSGSAVLIRINQSWRTAWR